ncbi:MAG: T9SS type A sorting domain-containing protein [Ferruginibacter sp.]
MAGTLQLRVPILNLSSTNSIPAGSCKIKIGLGSKLIIEPGFNLTTTNTSTYFSWTSALVGGQVQLTGDLIAPLPPNYNITGIFQVQGSLEGSSTLTTNFLVTNHNTSQVLSDDNPNNNTSFLPYTVIVPIPVTFTGVSAKKSGCEIQVNFSSENEINIDHYEVEVSKDGQHYKKAGRVNANQAINYIVRFPLTAEITAPVIYVRVKSIDMDGSFQYSLSRPVKGTCVGNDELGLYPNPVPEDQSEIFIRNFVGIFNGKVIVELLDMNGRLIRKNELLLNNVKQFAFNTGLLPAGQYLFKIYYKDLFIIRFEKL